MLTKLVIRNFKRFEDAEIDLGKNVVFIGPNNSGKTTALQALTLWDVGLRKWLAEKKESEAKKRPGLVINRRDLVAVPVPQSDLLWRQTHTRNVRRFEGKQDTQNVRIAITVSGQSGKTAWKCGIEFDYSNQESFYCRPLRMDDSKNPERMPIPLEASNTRVAYLPPMSGLTDREFRKEQGEMSFLIGQGQTAQVLRNLCYNLYTSEEHADRWTPLCESVQELFGVRLLPPERTDLSELLVAYEDQDGCRLDISSAGRGLQQTLLLLSFIYANPGSVLLLDEPDAHLEILRQRQNYQLISEVAERENCQIIAASHSEVVMNEAAQRDTVVAFVGKPHRIDDRGSEVLKSLREIGFDKYYSAEQRGWVLFLEGSTDLAILRAFARTCKHEAGALLEAPFVEYVANDPRTARRLFDGLVEAKTDLVGLALFDRLPQTLQQNRPLQELMWRRCEIENYLCSEDVLVAYAGHGQPDDLIGRMEVENRRAIMRECIAELVAALKVARKADPWSADIKVTDLFLDPLFENYYERLNLPNQMRKTNYHVLAGLVPADRIDPEVIAKLDAIVAVAKQAKPVQ
jgi:ABC-type lipoprotein export system ATPase subunit